MTFRAGRKDVECTLCRGSGQRDVPHKAKRAANLLRLHRRVNVSRILGVCSSARRLRRLASKDVDITERVWLQKVLDGARASVRGRHAAWDEGLHEDEEREEDERADCLHRGHFSETGRLGYNMSLSAQGS